MFTRSPFVTVTPRNNAKKKRRMSKNWGTFCCLLHTIGFLQVRPGRYMCVCPSVWRCSGLAVGKVIASLCVCVCVCVCVFVQGAHSCTVRMPRGDGMHPLHPDSSLVPSQSRGHSYGCSGLFTGKLF